MSKIIFHDFSSPPDVPTNGQTLMYTMAGEAHILSPDGTDVTIRSAQLPVTRIETLASTSLSANASLWVAIGNGLTFTATNNQYLVMVSYGFVVSNLTANFLGVRINGLDTIFNALMAGQVTNGLIVPTVIGTQYTIQTIIRNNAGGGTLATTGGFLMVQETQTP